MTTLRGRTVRQLDGGSDLQRPYLPLLSSNNDEASGQNRPRLDKPIIKNKPYAIHVGGLDRGVAPVPSHGITFLEAACR